MGDAIKYVTLAAPLLPPNIVTLFKNENIEFIYF